MFRSKNFGSFILNVFLGEAQQKHFDFDSTVFYTFYLFPGVLMWEVFTCGKMPYGRLKNTEVVDRVQRGIILEKPKACFKEVYEVRV